MSRVFADTFYFLALLNSKDPAHHRAVATAQSIQGDLVTTAWVLTELGDAMSDPENRPEFISTQEDLRNDPQVNVEGGSKWRRQAVEIGGAGLVRNSGRSGIVARGCGVTQQDD